MDARELISLMASTLGLELKEVELQARRAREAGFFVKQTRGKDSPRPQARDAAVLLLLCMVGAPAGRAPEVLDRLSKTNRSKIEVDPSEAIERSEIQNGLSILLEEGHCVVDAISDLIKYAYLDDQFDFHFANSVISFNQSEHELELSLVLNPHFCADRFQNSDAIAALYKCEDVPPFDGHLVRMSEIGIQPIGIIGRALRRGGANA